MTQFEEEYRWHQEQARLSREDDKTDSGITLHALPSQRTARHARQEPLELAQRMHRIAMRWTKDCRSTLELWRRWYAWLDCNRLRAELDAVQGVIR
jgi:hypothetical protein